MSPGHIDVRVTGEFMLEGTIKTFHAPMAIIRSHKGVSLAKIQFVHSDTDDLCS